MKKWKQLFFIGALTLGGVSAGATCSTNSCFAELSRIYTTSAVDGRVYVKPVSSTAPLRCSKAEGQYLTLFDTHKRFDEIYRTMNMALILRKAIRIRIEENSPGCKIIYVMIDR